jgi:hypothetical protein
MTPRETAKRRLLFKIAQKMDHWVDEEAAKKELGAFTSPEDYEAAAPKVQPPKSMPATKPQAPTPAPSGLSPDIVEKLNKGSPGLKGMLFVQQDGTNLRIGYNIERAQRTANQMKTILTNALPGYRVDVLGYSNPEWAPNY